MRLQPVMELKSHIAHIKTVEAGVAVSYGGTYVTKGKTVIATIPVGYADGYSRGLSNRGVCADSWKEGSDSGTCMYGSVYGGCDRSAGGVDR